MSEENQEETLDKLAKAGAIGVPAYLITAAGTDQLLKKLKIKNPLSQTKLAIMTAVEGSKTAKNALKLGKTVTGLVGDVVIDAAIGGMSIAETAKNTSMNSGEKGYAITADAIGIAANIGINVATGAALSGAGVGTTAGATLAAGAATGPGVIIAVAIVALQILGGILDAFVANPFQSLFNRDLKDMHDAYHSALKKAYLDIGLNWPIEIKPDIVGIAFGTNENVEKYIKYMREYYKDNGLITQEEFEDEWELLLNLRKIRRISKKYIVDENDNIIGIKDPVRNAIDITSDVESNILLMFALSARIAKYKKKEIKQKPSIIKQFVETYYIAIIFWFILLILIFILSIFFLLII